jgi:hypothetical protein
VQEYVCMKNCLGWVCSKQGSWDLHNNLHFTHTPTQKWDQFDTWGWTNAPISTPSTISIASCPVGNVGLFPCDKADWARSWSHICISCQGSVFVHTHIGSTTGLHAVHRHSSTVLSFTTVHVYGYSIYRVFILFDEHIFHFPLCLWVPRGSRQHKSRQAADKVVCEISRLPEI